MIDYSRQLDDILALVEKPSRYIGGEYHSIKKDPASVGLRVALCYPDLYEIGMSHLGFKILYHLLNSDQDIAAERFFAPWVDMRDQLKGRGLPLLSMENGSPLKNFNAVGFSLQYELNFTNVLMMLELGDLPLKSSDRKEGDPIVIAGGPAAFNPEPMAEFMDLFVIGDGEEVLLELVDLFKQLLKAGAKREEVIQSGSKIKGVYVPAFYKALQERQGFQIPCPVGDAPLKIERRILQDIEAFPFPEKIIVPHCEIVHDRVSYEIMRGCLTGCRFCQAGYIYRPKRERSLESIRKGIVKSLRNTGYEEASLTSLNSGEYRDIEDLLEGLMDDFSGEHIFLSLPSLKPSSLSEGIVRQIKRGRKTGFTIAPEAGTEKLRKVINKNISHDDILSASDLAFREGWNLLKLYFMIGLPTEDEEDLSGIVDLIREISKRSKQRGNGRARMNVSISSFIPKSHTPFQWMPMESLESLIEKQQWIKDKFSSRWIRVKWHDARMSLIEAVFSRGDRKLSAVLEKAFHLGCAFDGWGDQFDFSKWEEAFQLCGVDPKEYAHRAIDRKSPLPWDIIDTGVTKDFLAQEMERALRGEGIETCRQDLCHECSTFANVCQEVMKPSAEIVVRKTAMSKGREEDPAIPPHYRYRVKYEKRGKLRFLSHLDMTRTILRSLKRSGIPLVYSKGFHPKPKVSFGPALAVGIESSAEYFDFDSHRYLREQEFLSRAKPYLTEGLIFTRLKKIPKSAPSLSETLNVALYRIRCKDEEENDHLRQKMQSLEELSKSEDPSMPNREDIKNFFARIMRIDDSGKEGVGLLYHLKKGEKVRVGDILKILLNREDWVNYIERKEMFVEKDGKFFTPLLEANQSRSYVQRNDH
jgi:radical SAM family uncharacterized protein/radical SAM-linked protein